MSATATWCGIAAIVISATAGDVLQSSAMKQIGDIGLIRQSRGMSEVVRRIVTNARFMFGMLFMTLGFFSLLVTLSWNDVSLVGPASASLTFIANAIAARIFLKERVDHRRWMAAVLVSGGVAVLAR